MTADVLVTPLHANHLALGAKMVPFAGYDMPVQYSSVIAETRAVRDGAGMFDVSHMARLEFSGERVVEFIEWITSNDFAKLEIGTGQYSLLPNPQGGVVDDIIVYRTGPEKVNMVVNAANHAKDVAWIESQNTFDVDILDYTDETAMIAVQGPSAVSILADLSDDPGSLNEAGMFGVVQCNIAGVSCFAARSGYTGEDGFELICSAPHAGKLWDALVAAGVKPCGLASRDALRVEAGLPLYGHELGDDRNPITAGLGWVVGKEKDFIGSGPIRAAKENGVAERLVGIRLDSKRLPAPGMGISVDGVRVGEVCSGVYSPMLECGIAFAFVNSEIKLNTACTINIRDKEEPATIVNKRFFKRA